MKAKSAYSQVVALIVLGLFVGGSAGQSVVANAGASGSAAGASSSDAGAGGASACNAGACPVPKSIQLTTSVMTETRGGAAEKFFQDHCPDGQVVIGFSGSLEAEWGFLMQIQAHCGTLSVERAELGQYVVKLKPGSSLPMHGTNKGASGTPGYPASATCPADHVVVGFTGRSNLYVDRIVLQCAPLHIIDTAAGPTLTFGTSYLMRTN